jgi:hypothetical protein
MLLFAALKPEAATEQLQRPTNLFAMLDDGPAAAAAVADDGPRTMMVLVLVTAMAMAMLLVIAPPHW